MKGPRILFITQCGAKLGFGHLVRSQRLARALSPRYQIAFLAEGIKGFEKFIRPHDIWQKIKPSACIVTDLVQPQRLKYFAEIVQHHPIISIHDMGLGQFDSDCAIDGSIVQIVPYPQNRKNLFFGARYMILDHLPERRRGFQAHREAIIMNFGGGDVAPIYRKALKAMRLLKDPMEIRACRGYMSWDSIKCPAVKWYGPGDNMWDAIDGCQIGLCAGGISLYELAASGVPALVISHHRAQERTAKEFESRGAAISLGTKRRVTIDLIRRGVETLRCAVETRRKMGRAGRQLVDGHGIDRVCKIIERYAS